MKEEVITVGISDDHALFREGIISLMRDYNIIEFTLEAENGRDVLTKLKNGIPDVLLLDLDMPVMDGIETLKILKSDAAYENLKVIILTMHTEERMITYLMELGANGFITKDSRPEEISTAITTVHKQGYYFNDSVSQAMLKGLKDKSKKTPKLGDNYQLTSRELEVLQLIAQGLTTTEIGEKLFLSNRTIEGHRKNLLSKLGARNTATLIITAIKEGIISID